MSDERLFQDADEQEARYAPQQLPDYSQLPEGTTTDDRNVDAVQQVIVADSAATLVTPEAPATVGDVTITGDAGVAEAAAGLAGMDVAREAQATQTEGEDSSR